MEPSNLHMYHGIFEEHQVHDGIEVIVGFQRFLEYFVQALPSFDRAVLGLSHASGKVAVDERFSSQRFLVQILIVHSCMQG